MSARHALVIGKFYPPHAGHAHLVREAARRAERVTVIVLAASAESIPLELRVGWLTEIHAADRNVEVLGAMDDHPVDYRSAAAWEAHVGVMKRALAEGQRPPVDLVATSEAYGDELARRFGAEHLLVDLARATVPVSGSAVRLAPARHWAFLAPPVRAHYVLRVVFVGAESTGKTTLASSVTEALRARGGALAGTEWVPERGRGATEEKLAALGPGASMNAIRWDSSDFVAIAREQARLEDEAARRGGPVLVCDTDAFATGVWHERYMGARSPDVEALGTTARRLYLLTHHDDVPFEQDGIRDGEALRAWMTHRFAERLAEVGADWSWLRGDLAARHRATLDHINRAL